MGRPQRGRPPLTPRIEALEKRVHDLEEAVLELTERFKGPMDQPKPEGYKPLYSQWGQKPNGSP